MMPCELTEGIPAATTCSMAVMQQEERRSGGRAVRAGLVLMGMASLLSGCISVSAPDKPIVIELNINIKQEVIYRIAADAANTIDANPEIF